MKVAIIGATGVVGKKLRECLESSSLDIEEIVLAASAKSVGSVMMFAGSSQRIVSINECWRSKPDLAFFAAGSTVSLDWAPKFAEIGCYVIDKSSAWRMDNRVPLVIPGNQ